MKGWGKLRWVEVGRKAEVIDKAEGGRGSEFDCDDKDVSWVQQ